MSTAPATSSCPVCEQPLPAGAREGCPSCHAPPATLELLDALDFVARRFEQWHRDGQLNAQRHQSIAGFYGLLRREIAEATRAGAPLPGELRLPPPQQCWSCQALRQRDALCDRCGAPLDGPAVRSLRYLTLLMGEIKRQAQAGRLSLAQAHALQDETRGRLAALQQRLEKGRVPVVRLAPRRAQAEPLPVVELAEPAAPRKPLLELLLDPRNIQWLLGLGGALLVLGLVLWLGTLRLFDNRGVIAVGLGLANGAALLGGWALIRGTRFQTAGRALTLLACLVMPLNLWFYDAHNLITLEGHLWLAALACCALYAASALVLRDPLFVYVLMAGVALTGLLILADQDVRRFWEVAAPATLLVGLGLAGILAERAFPEGEGPFTRRRFGLAFFFSGHALLGAGLLFVLGAQLAGWTWTPALHPWGLAELPAIVTDQALKLLALGLFLAGCAAYLYSDLVVRKIGVYVYLAAFCLLWSELLAVLALDVAVPSEVIILVLALTACAVNLLQAAQGGRGGVARAVPPLGLLLSILPVLYGLCLHLRATNLELNRLWTRADGGRFAFTWGYVGALLVTALACRLGAYLYRRRLPELSVAYFFLTAAATLVGAAGLASVLGLDTWDKQAPVLMLLPIAYLVAARLYRGHTPENPLVWVAHTATGVMAAAVTLAALQFDPVQVFTPYHGQALNLRLALFGAEAALFYALAATWRRDGVSVYLAAAAACGSVWQLLHFFQVGGEYHPLAFALVGLGLLVVYRLAVLERYRRGGLADAAFQCANALLSVAFVAAVLLTLSRLAVSLPQPGRPAAEWQAPLRALLAVLVALAAMSLVAAWLVRHSAWRRWYVIAALLEGLLACLLFNLLSVLSPWEKFEVFCVVLGVLLLGLGHWGWYREQEWQSDLVSVALVLGSLAVALPLGIAVVVHRSTASFSTFNELGLLVLGLLLLTSGVVLQLRATTLSGGLMVGLYVLTLPMFLRTPQWLEKLEGAALWMIFGGGAVFLVGLLLSVYRDRLLALPEKIRRREGIFRLLSWR
jgi:hypothetical protein